MKKIVLIEDNPDVRENIAEILELADYQVFTAGNGRVGVIKVKNHLPDLVVCDIMMPELDGFGVLHILSKNPETASIPFIFLTAKAEKSDMRKGMNLGADDYLTKPFEETELLDAVEVRLKRHAAFKKEFENNKSGFNTFIQHAQEVKSLEGLSKDRKTKSYKPKETIYSEGDYANYLYLLNKGKVKSTKTDEYGKQLVVDMHEPGDFIGYMALLKDEDYTETVTALEDSEIIIIPKQDFMLLIESNRDVANTFIKMLANNVKEKEERLLQLAYTPVRERVADVLIKLFAQDKNATIQMSREDLASMVGTATETLIRTLSSFKSDGIIETEGRNIVLKDEKSLKKAAGMV